MTALFDGAARSRIEDAIREAESKTSTEIVVHVAKRSDGYALWRCFGAFLATLSASAIAHVVFPHLAAAWLLLAQLPVAVAFYWACGFPPVLVALAPDTAEVTAVHRQAALTFLARGVHETRDRTGVLIFISELERRVEILADRGIHEQFGVGVWDDLVKRIIDAIRSGSAEIGVVSAIATIGEKGAVLFPPRDGDTNELPDAVALDTGQP